MADRKPDTPPEIHEISREKTPVQEEFIAPEARPSRDVHDVPCPACGKPRQDWESEGVQRGEAVYCSRECAEKRD